MTTQQVTALFVICAFVIGLFAYAYLLGRKAGRTHRQPGLFLDMEPGGVTSYTIANASPQVSNSNGSGSAVAQAIGDAIPASIRDADCIDAKKTKSLCCEAAGIINTVSSSAEAQIPHDKLREAAPVDATLIANTRPPAQPAEGYTHTSAVSCIVAAMEAKVAEHAGTYATSEQMAQAIEAAMKQAGLLSPTDESWQVVLGRLDESLIQREAEQRKHHHSVANLTCTIAELEERIMSYTGLAVTNADYEKLVSVASTMRLAQRTFKALKSEAEATRAGSQADVIDGLAGRIHAQLRTTPASAVKAGAAA